SENRGDRSKAEEQFNGVGQVEGANSETNERYECMTAGKYPLIEEISLE
ncbi:hypothetical protein A2U01_0086128, partial [Trifolium medium]|nr:hypothetical protein [Trifolium medium]